MTKDRRDHERRNLIVRVSSVTQDELEAGEYDHKEKTRAVMRREKRLAVAVTHEVDDLFTGNHAHLANPLTQQKLQEMCPG